MKTITISIPDDIYKELTRFLFFRHLCGKDVGIDFDVLAVIIHAIEEEWKEVIINEKKVNKDEP